MLICEESSSSSTMEFCEDDIKIEEISVEDEGEYSDNPCDSTSSPRNMIFTQIYVPQDACTLRDIQGMLASSSVDMKGRPGRKQKLEHLSFEEKLLRKKLKNREAAQTSRDRKKARMTDLEMQVRLLQEQNERLRLEKENACKENERLKLQLSNPPAATHPASVTAPCSSTMGSVAEHISLNGILTQVKQEVVDTPAQVSPLVQVTPLQEPVTSSVPSAPASLNGETSRVASSIGQESAEFLELSPQQTADRMQEGSRSVQPSASRLGRNLGQEVLVMLSTVASLLLAIVLTQVSGQPQTGIGCLTLSRGQLESAFSSLSSSQQGYLNQLLLVIAKELDQVPRWWGTHQQAWNPVHFLHSNVPLFLQHLPPLPPPGPSAPRRPSLGALVAATMKRVPVPC